MQIRIPPVRRLRVLRPLRSPVLPSERRKARRPMRGSRGSLPGLRLDAGDGSGHLLDDQPGGLEDRHVLLDGREAHREPPREVRHRVVGAERQRDDLAPRRVGQGVEHPVDVCGGQIYNHIVVR